MIDYAVVMKEREGRPTSRTGEGEKERSCGFTATVQPKTMLCYSSHASLQLPKALGRDWRLIGHNTRSDRVSITENCWTSLGLVVGVRNGWLDQILIGDSVQWFRDTAGGSGMHIQRSGRSGLGLGVVRDCSGGWDVMDMTAMDFGGL